MSLEHSTGATVAVPKRFSFDLAASWALVLTLVLSTIVLIPSSSIPFLYTKISVLVIGSLITLVLYIIARLTRGNVIVPPLFLLGILWLIPLAYALSTLFSSVRPQAAFFGTDLETDTFGFVLLLAALATITALMFRRAQHYRVFFNTMAILFAAVLLAQAGFVIAAQIVPKQIVATVNLIGSFSDLGMFVGLGIILTLLALRFLNLSRRVRTGLIIAWLLGLAILALVNSVLIWGIVALVGLGLFIAAIMRRTGTTDETDLDGVSVISPETDAPANGLEPHALITPLITLVLGIFFLIGNSTIGSALVSAAHVNFIDVRPSWQSTFDVGKHTYASSPVFGSGPNTFVEQWLRFRDATLNNTIFWNVDFTSGVGYIPTSFVTTGVLGTLAWLAFIILFLLIGLRALLLRLPTDTYVRFVSIASFTGASYVLALAVLSVPGPVVLALGFVCIGIFISTLRYSGGHHEWGVIFSKNPRIGFAIVFGLTLLLLGCVLAAYVAVERYFSDISYNAASAALSAQNLDAASADVNRSILFAPSDRAYQLAAAIGIARMNKIVADTTLAPDQARQQFQSALNDSINAALTATRLDPNNYQNWAVLGNVYSAVVPLNIDGAYDNAKAAYGKAVALNPTNPTLPFILAQLEITKGNAQAAEQDLTTAINLKHDYTQAIFLFSQLKVSEGQAKEALQAAEAAAFLAPNDPVVLFQVGILRSANGDTAGAITALQQSVKANPQYANARFFLGVEYAIKGQYQDALTQLETVAALSPANAQAIASDIDALKAGRNPFPPSRLGALGIPPPVSDQSGTTNASVAK